MKHLGRSIWLYVILTIITGLLYPFGLAAIGRIAFPKAVSGSVLEDSHGKAIGSSLLAQDFQAPTYFHPRPSTTNFKTLPSGASQWGPTHQNLQEKVAERRELLGVLGKQPPFDALFASGSGLDPHISVTNAHFQIDRVARARGLNESGKRDLLNLVDQVVEPRQYGVFGQPRVNVLELNQRLASMFLEQDPNFPTVP